MPPANITLDLTWVAVTIGVLNAIVVWLTFRRTGKKWQTEELEKCIAEKIAISRGQAAPLQACLAAFFGNAEGIRLREHVTTMEVGIEEIKSSLDRVNDRLDTLIRNGRGKT